MQQSPGITGGRINVETEGVSRQSIKNRLNQAPKVAGVKLKFHRSSQDQVVFELVEK